MVGDHKRPHIRSCWSASSLRHGFNEGVDFIARFFLAVSKPASLLSEALIYLERPSACTVQGRNWGQAECICLWKDTVPCYNLRDVGEGGLCPLLKLSKGSCCGQNDRLELGPAFHPLECCCCFKLVSVKNRLWRRDVILLLHILCDTNFAKAAWVLAYSTHLRYLQHLLPYSIFSFRGAASF